MVPLLCWECSSSIWLCLLSPQARWWPLNLGQVAGIWILLSCCHVPICCLLIPSCFSNLALFEMHQGFSKLVFKIKIMYCIQFKCKIDHTQNCAHLIFHVLNLKWQLVKVIWSEYFIGSKPIGYMNIKCFFSGYGCLLDALAMQMMISSSSLLSILVIERVDERVGLSCLISLLSLILVSSACERYTSSHTLACSTYGLSRKYRKCVIIICCSGWSGFLMICAYGWFWISFLALQFLQFYSCFLQSIHIQGFGSLLQVTVPDPLHPNLVTPIEHLCYWRTGAGFYLLARFEGLADRKVYSVNRYFISGHSLEHLCFAMVTLILTVMLTFRNIKIARYLHGQMFEMIGVFE